MTSRLILLPFLLLFCASTLRAQNEIDAVRQAQHGHGIGARAIAIGPAYSAISDDYAAVFLQPRWTWTNQAF